MVEIRHYPFTVILLFCATIANLVQFSVSETRQQSRTRIPEELFLQPLASRVNNISSSSSSSTNSKLHSSKTLLEPIIIHHKKGSGKVEKTEERSSSTSSTTKELCQGACLPSKLSCLQHDGVQRGTCVKGAICCQFERTCGEISREKVSFFRSPNYPEVQNDSLDCTYDIYPNEDVCALKVEFLTFKIKRSVHYSKTEKCVTDALFLLNTDRGANEPLCDMENNTAIVYVKKGSVSPVKFVLISQGQDAKWNLKITQINCRKVTTWQNEPKCGRQLMYDPAESGNNANSVEDSDNDSSFSKEFSQQSSSSSGLQLHLHPLIVNGKDAENREFPWQISLQTKGKGSHRCGGSILNKNHILTAAHCVMRNAYESRDKLKVIVGDYMLNDTQEVEHQEFAVASIIGHFHYKPHNSHVNDIAILKLMGSINYSPNIQPVCLPPKNFSTANQSGWVSGWGRLNGSDPKATASTLQKLQVSIIDDDECRSLVQIEVQKILKRNVTSDEMDTMAQLGRSRTQLCAQPKLHSAVCFGDSGGPLVVQNAQDGSYVQVGVVSYGLGKCVTDRNPPAAYTRISEFLDFIAIATSEDF